MCRLVAALLLLAAVLGASASTPEVPANDAPSGRQLLQGGPSVAECDRSIKNCEVCRFQFFRGTQTKVGGFARRAAPVAVGWVWLCRPAAEKTRPLSQAPAHASRGAADSRRR